MIKDAGQTIIRYDGGKEERMNQIRRNEREE